MTIATERFVSLKERRRNLAGRTGCGLCGTESRANRDLPGSDEGAEGRFGRSPSRILRSFVPHQRLP